jgi:hypothetical protein
MSEFHLATIVLVPTRVWRFADDAQMLAETTMASEGGSFDLIVSRLIIRIAWLGT